MRYMALSFCLVGSLFAKEFDVAKIAEQVQSIKKSNKLSPSLPYEVYDPFATAKPILIEKKRKRVYQKKERAIVAQTILNDKVFIDGKWYSKDDVIRGYKISKISKKSVLLYKSGSYKRVYLKRSKNIVKIEEKIK